MTSRCLDEGSGTVEDPYAVGWLPGEKEDPYNWSRPYKFVSVSHPIVPSFESARWWVNDS
jgi:hypothetical protein